MDGLAVGAAYTPPGPSYGCRNVAGPGIPGPYGLTPKEQCRHHPAAGMNPRPTSYPRGPHCRGRKNPGLFSTIRAFPVEKWFGVSLPTFFAKKVGGKSPLGRSTFAVRVFITCSHSVYFGAVIHCVKGLSTLKMLKTLWKEWKTTPVFRLKMWKTRWKALCRAVLVPKFSTGGLWRPGRGLTRPRYLCTIRIIQNCAKE